MALVVPWLQVHPVRKKSNIMLKNSVVELEMGMQKQSNRATFSPGLLFNSVIDSVEAKIAPGSPFSPYRSHRIIG